MRVFKTFPKKHKCPLCNGNEDNACVLIAKVGTQDGKNVESVPVHLDCLQLWYDPANGVIYQQLPLKNVVGFNVGIVKAKKVSLKKK